jgi:prevent-host-death family protein
MTSGGMTSMTVSAARAALPDLLNQVEHGAKVTITRRGRPVAVVVRPDALRSRRVTAALADAERIHELPPGAAVGVSPVRGGLTAERVDELIAEIRAGREAR